MGMSRKEAIRIITLVAVDQDHGAMGAIEDQDIAAEIVLAELHRLKEENRTLKKENRALIKNSKIIIRRPQYER